MRLSNDTIGQLGRATRGNENLNRMSTPGNRIIVALVIMNTFDDGE